MCTVLLPPAGYPIAFNKYIISIAERYVSQLLRQQVEKYQVTAYNKVEI
jgi:hypothetical protein